MNSRGLVGAGAVVVLAVTAVCYLPLLGNGFVDFGDPERLVGNELVQTLDVPQIGEIFRHQVFTPDYAPLASLSWAIEYRLFGLEPRAFHLGSLALHLANVGLVIALLWGIATGGAPVEVPKRRGPVIWRGTEEEAAALDERLRASGRIRERRDSVVEDARHRSGRYLELGVLLAGAYFALHPLRVEAVAWAADRPAVLFAFFYLAALFAYLRFCLGDRRGIFVSAGLYVLATFSKGMSITLPLALFVVDLALGRQPNWRRLGEKWPFLPAFGFAVWLYGGRDLLSLLSTSGVAGVLRDTTLAGYRYLTFLRRMLLPDDLAPYYRVPAFLSDPGPTEIALILAPFPFLALFLILFWRQTRRVSASILFFSIAVSPALVAAAAATSLAPDRSTYLPAVGVAALLGLAAAGLSRLSRSAVWIVAVLSLTCVVALSLATRRQVGVWRDTVTLWDHVIATQGPEPIPLHNRALARDARGDHEGAVRDYDHAISLDPDYPAAHANRGRARARLGDPAGAAKDLGRASELAPDDPSTWDSLGRALTRAGRPREAVAALDRAIELDDASAERFLLRGRAHAASGHPLEAVADFSRTLSMRDRSLELEALIERSEARTMAGDFSAAEADSTRAIRIDPEGARGYRSRGSARFHRGELDGALEDYDRAIELRPDYEVAYRERGDVKVALERVVEGCDDWLAALGFEGVDRRALEERLAEFCPARE